MKSRMITELVLSAIGGFGLTMYLIGKAEATGEKDKASELNDHATAQLDCITDAFHKDFKCVYDEGDANASE